MVTSKGGVCPDGTVEAGELETVLAQWLLKVWEYVVGV